MHAIWRSNGFGFIIITYENVYTCINGFMYKCNHNNYQNSDKCNSEWLNYVLSNLEQITPLSPAINAIATTPHELQ